MSKAAQLFAKGASRVTFAMAQRPKLVYLNDLFKPLAATLPASFRQQLPALIAPPAPPVSTAPVPAPAPAPAEPIASCSSAPTQEITPVSKLCKHVHVNVNANAETEALINRSLKMLSFVLAASCQGTPCRGSTTAYG